MERPIDHHEVRRPSRSSDTFSHRLNQWRESWYACYEIVQEWETCDLTAFHEVFERWVPILNWTLENPIPRLERYEPFFYYCKEPNGPNEIFKLFMEDFSTAPTIERVPVHIIFNLYEFKNIQKRYCSGESKINQMLVDEDRGMIHLASHRDRDARPATYFQNMTTWILLFIFTCHALAHWDAYDKYEECSYDKHLYVRDSPFFKLYHFGKVSYRHR